MHEYEHLFKFMVWSRGKFQLRGSVMYWVFGQGDRAEVKRCGCASIVELSAGG